ncbi:MAG TPA: M28 family peptidase [Candidatus Acidoferrales bacterium]|nr:M28 family peptidase [Candidatus Acidoferrales bacterium]
MDSPRGPGVRRVFTAALVLAAIFLLSLAGLIPPSPKSADAPPNIFSALRAWNVLRRILGPDVPHPVGSPADDNVRANILDELARLGYQPQVQTGFACGTLASCATVNNVVARLDGYEPGQSVLLAAHYDSVPAGPGDSDDGVGAACVLEIARALKSMPTPRHSVIFLLDEGEEAGLLGARAFVDSSPWAKDVRAAVNVDARGASGPSLMFETGSANRWAVQLLARHATRPATSSIFYTAYQYIPNDTDFTVFKAEGYQGLNFAFIDSEQLYHTPLDNSANVSLATLQHQGQNALEAIVALANADLSILPEQEAVFFDVFGRFVVRWPARRTWLWALGAMILFAAQCVWMIYRKRMTPAQLYWGAIVWLVMIAVTGALALILVHLIRIGGAAQVNWVAHPLPLEIAFWSLAASVVITNGIVFTKRAGFWGLWSGVWAWWTLLAVVVAALAPGLSYILAVPAGVAAVAGLSGTLANRDRESGLELSAILPLAAAGIVGFPPAILLYTGLGNAALLLIAMLIAVLLTPLSPLCADLRGASGLRGLALPWLPILATGLAAFAAIVVPTYSAKAPERVNIEYWLDADSGVAHWIVQPASGRLPEPIRLADAFQRTDHGALPWDARPAFVAEAPHLEFAAPTFTILESSQGDGKRNYRTLLRSERGAPFAAVFFPPEAGIENVRVGGEPLSIEAARFRQYYNGWNVYSCPTMPMNGIEISFSAPVGKPIEVIAADQSYSLPSDGAFLLQARPLTARPSQSGDVTIVSRRVQLIP